MFRNRLQARALSRGLVSFVNAFVVPLMPTLVEKPPEGGDWIHEVKFDGYRSQIIMTVSGSTRATATTGRRNIATW